MRNKFFIICLIAGNTVFSAIPDSLLSDKDIIMADEYYKKPYSRDPNDFKTRNVGATSYTVFRPNHGLAHAMRKSALAIDTLKVMKDAMHNNLGAWIRHNLSPNTTKNPNFAQQLAFAMLMLRTGRSSESKDVDQYKEDCYKSAEIFAQEAAKSPWFPNPQDIENFKFAMQMIGDISKCFDFDGKKYSYTESRGCTPERLNIYNFLYAVHHLDLRRLFHFDKERILSSIASYLGFYNADNKANTQAPEVQKLWQRAGEYLKLTGDRDIDGKPPFNTDYQDIFFILSSNPQELHKQVQALMKTPF